MVKSSTKQDNDYFNCINEVSASDNGDSSGAAASFRSPVGCTSATPGEAEFLAWCREERVRFPSSHLAVLPATGRALVASRSIKMGEVVVEVPDDAVLMADNSTLRDVLEEEGMCKPADDEILEVQGLIIAVMYEKFRGKKSRWAPYLNLIPDDMTHMPLYWKRREFQELRGTAAYDKMMGMVQHPADAPTQVPLLWCEVVEPFIQEHPELGMPGGKEGYDLYRWATCAVASYSFILGDDKYQAMVPVWDLLNHVTGRVNVRLHHCARRHVLQMIATRNIVRGEELLNNYGELSNAELLRGYGFVEESNRNNHVQVPLGFVVRAVTEELQRGDANAGAEAEAGAGLWSARGAQEGQRQHPLTSRLRLARRCGLLPTHHVFKLFAGRPPPTTLTALIHLLLASDAEAAGLRIATRRAERAAAAGRGRSSGSGAGRGGAKMGSQAALQAQTAAALAAAEQGSDAALGRVARVYNSVVQRMLRRYGAGLKEDEQLLATWRAGRKALLPRLHAAVLARKPEKEALLSLREIVGRASALRKSLLLGYEAGGCKSTLAMAGGGAQNVAPGVGATGDCSGDGTMRTAASCVSAANSRFAAAKFSFSFQL